MRRLEERAQVLVAAADHESRPFYAYLLAIHGCEAALHPDDPFAVAAEVRRVLPDALLSFFHGRGMVSLRGELRVGRTYNALTFTVNDGVMLPRRAAARLDIVLPVTVAPVTLSQRRAVKPAECMTVNISSEGILVEVPARLSDLDELAVELALPDGPPVLAVSRVVRRDQGGVALHHMAVAGDGRERVKEFVIERKRAQLLPLLPGGAVGSTADTAASIVASVVTRAPGPAEADAGAAAKREPAPAAEPAGAFIWGQG